MERINRIEGTWVEQLDSVRRGSFLEIQFVVYMISLLVLGFTRNVDLLLIPILFLDAFFTLYGIFLFAVFNRLSKGTLRQRRLISWLRLNFTGLVLTYLGLLFFYNTLHYAEMVSSTFAGIVGGSYIGSALLSFVMGFLRPDVLRNSFIGIERERQRTPEENVRVYKWFGIGAAILIFILFLIPVVFSALFELSTDLLAFVVFGGFSGWMMLIIGLFGLGQWLFIIRHWLVHSSA